MYVYIYTYSIHTYIYIYYIYIYYIYIFETFNDLSKITKSSVKYVNLKTN